MRQKEDMKRIRDAKQEWEENTLKTSVEKLPERKKEFTTTSGISLHRLYTPEDFTEQRYLVDLGFAGQHPYTRGIQPTMYRSRFWTMRQYAGYGSAEETNKRFRYLLGQGQTGLSVAFDLPTQIGYDSDHPLARGEVGRVGVAIDSLEDMETLFAHIPLEKVSTSMTINATAALLLAMYLVLAKKRNIPFSQLAGTVQNDILKEYIARGTYIFPPQPALRIITDIITYCQHNVPRWNTMSISGYHIREAGSTAVQEIAFTLANAIAYVEAVLQRGLDVDDFAPRLSFFFNSHNNFLEEVAKFRAARRLWSRIMKERFKAKNPRSMKLRFHVQTAGCTLTAQQPDNNIIRVTLQALAAVLGGAQSLHTNSRDEALALPTQESVQIALRTQQIIAYEAGVADTIDPLGGSYAIEKLTNEIESKAKEYIQKIDDLGGSLPAIEHGFFQREIHDAAYRYQKEVESNQRIIVGVNKFASPQEESFSLLNIDSSLEERQIKNLMRLREKRDNAKTISCLKELEKVAASDGNIMPAIIEAVEAYATIGEMSDSLRKVFGEYKNTVSPF
jgi:methylmalonyl-CoA mutase N-terminal domain/subunit